LAKKNSAANVPTKKSMKATNPRIAWPVERVNPYESFKMACKTANSKMRIGELPCRARNDFTPNLDTNQEGRDAR
jgi:hypothetical protein